MREAAEPARLGKAIHNPPLRRTKHLILGIVQQLLLREGWGSQKLTTICTKQLSLATAGSWAGPLPPKAGTAQAKVKTLAWQRYKCFSPALPVCDCNRRQRKYLGRGQYKSSIQQCNGDNYRLSTDLVNPFSLGLNNSLNKFWLSSFLCNILKLHVGSFPTNKICGHFSSSASTGWLLFALLRGGQGELRRDLEKFRKKTKIFFPLFAVHQFYSKTIRISLNILKSWSLDFLLQASKKYQVENFVTSIPVFQVKHCQLIKEYQQNPGCNICTTGLGVSHFLSGIQILLGQSLNWTSINCR